MLKIYDIATKNGVLAVVNYSGYDFDDDFDDCETLVIPDGVTNIKAGEYEDYKIDSVTIPNSVTRIGDEAFMGNEGLKSVTIPESIEHIGWNAFDYQHLNEIVFLSEYPPESEAPRKKQEYWKSCKLIVPAGCIDHYMSDSVWGKFKNISEKQ